ncbi:phosphate ABC transporter permease PstA [Haloferax sp. DFSO60]|uniref:phosphate ABC transporter permease PstA n=1 Tax=Haloferax sp. DFSO60 TaxID=3388652 RepID=UPI0039787FDA
MATENEPRTISGFGQVSRTAGTVFRYLLMAATMFGIVTLAVLLVYVANDAIQPLTADAGWHLTFFAVLVVPTVLAGGYLYQRNTDALVFGSMVLGMLVVSLMFASGLALVLIDIIPPLVAFSFAVAFVLPALVVVGLTKYDQQIPFGARVGLTGTLFYLSLFGFPGFIGSTLGLPSIIPSVADLIQSLPVVPTPWIMVTLMLGSVSGVVIGQYFADIRDDRTGLAAGLATFALTAVGALIGSMTGFGSVAMAIIASVSLLPTAAYAGGNALTNEKDRAGLVFVAIVLGGALLGAFIVNTLGFAGPQSWVDWQFLTSAHSGSAENAGLYPAIGGSILLMCTVAAMSFPVGVGAAVYLEEYAPNNKFTRFIDVNISNLAGVPSVVYGLLGLGVFVNYLGQSTGTVLIGGATLSLLILPIVIISSREAIRSVPNDLRQASYGMGATRWQTVRNVVLPESFPGILTGTILALGRAIGETAPLIMIGAPNVLFNLPTELSSKVSAMPLQVYAWSSLFASEDFYTKAVPAGVVVLLAVLLAMNSVAIVLRNKYERES